jgi:acyl carrier protein
MPAEILVQLKQLLANELGANRQFDEIDETASLFEDGLGLDSIMTIEFITLIEGHFGFQFAEGELTTEAFQNLHTLAQTISSKLEASPA